MTAWKVRNEPKDTDTCQGDSCPTRVVADSEPKRNRDRTTVGVNAPRLCNRKSCLVLGLEGGTFMNYLFRDDVIDTPNEDIPAAIPSLINAAVAAFDADRDTSRRYLLRASALLRVKRGACADADSARPLETRGLLAWQLNRVTD